MKIRAYEKRTVYTRYGECTHVFNPYINWCLGDGIFTINTRNDYGIGFYWGYGKSNWSRIKQKSITIGKLSIHIMLGRCSPYNPITGKVYK